MPAQCTKLLCLSHKIMSNNERGLVTKGQIYVLKSHELI